MGRTVADVALLDSVVTGAPAPATLTGLRIGVPRTLWSGLEGQVDTVVQAAKAKIAGAGPVLVDADMLTLSDKVIFPVALHAGWLVALRPGWLNAMGQAEAASLPISSHTFNEPSAHVLAVSPTAHWLEHLDLAGAVLTERLLPKDGMVAPRGPGLGIVWDEAAVAHHAWR